jgi:hypothetical protein
VVHFFILTKIAIISKNKILLKFFL